jgi:hypothetical protein
LSDQCPDRFHNYRAVPSRVEVTQTVHLEEPRDHLVENYSVRSACETICAILIVKRLRFNETFAIISPVLVRRFHHINVTI